MNKILFFATLKEEIGQGTIDIDAKNKTIGELKEILVESYPTLNLEGVMTAINEEFALDVDQIQEEDTIAFIPPVSGG